jgi:hypothetical protein
VVWIGSVAGDIPQPVQQEFQSHHSISGFTIAGIQNPSLPRAQNKRHPTTPGGLVLRMQVSVSCYYRTHMHCSHGGC